MMQMSELYNPYKQIIEDQTFYKHKWFIDYRLIKNFILGYFYINKIKNNNDLIRFNKNIKSDKFKNRITDIPKYYLDKDFLKEDIDLIKIFNFNYNRYLHIVPNTDFLIRMIELVAKNNMHAHILKKASTHLTINLYPLYKDTDLEFNIQEYLSRILGNIIVKCVYVNPDNFYKIIYKYDLYMLYDIQELLKFKPFEKIKEDDEIIIFNLSKTLFISQRLINDNKILEKYDINKLNEDFKFVYNYLNVFLEFLYINPCLINL